MKVLLLIVGNALIFLGGIISLRVAVELLKGTSEYSNLTGIIGLVVFGIVPVVVGLFLARRALSRQGSSRLSASEIANREN